MLYSVHAETKKGLAVGSSGLAEKRTNGLACIGIFVVGQLTITAGARSLARSYDKKQHLWHDSPRNRPMKDQKRQTSRSISALQEQPVVTIIALYSKNFFFLNNKLTFSKYYLAGSKRVLLTIYPLGDEHMLGRLDKLQRFFQTFEILNNSFFRVQHQFLRVAQLGGKHACMPHDKNVT